jgi:GT2 family glycosyltransferase
METFETANLGRTSEPIPDLSIILVGWNNKEYLAPCLRSLYACALRSRFDVVVVDNGSTDGSQAMLREEFPEVMLIQNEANVGLSCASNQGIAATHARFLLLLNNDTLVNGASLDAMVDFMDAHPDAAAVGGRLLNPDGSLQAADGRFPSLWREFSAATGLERLWPPIAAWRPDVEQARSVDWLGSACLLLRRKALAQVGCLDEEYFIYGDETDLQFRLKREGWKVYYLPSATTIHFGGRSLDRWRRRKMIYRGKILFFKKNYGAMQTRALQVMLGIVSLSKVVCWAAISFFPHLHERAHDEMRSNLAVAILCCNST